MVERRPWLDFVSHAILILGVLVIVLGLGTVPLLWSSAQKVVKA